MTIERDPGLRAGLPEAMRLLVQRHPRGLWEGHINLGATARFWLERHAALRADEAEIRAGIAAFREGRTEAEPFARYLLPRLRHFLGDLDGHHRVEDGHYFPLFTEAEPGLAGGFDLMEGDHEVIHERIEAVITTANGLLKVVPSGGDDLRRATDAYAAAQDALGNALARHLDDEEDLVIPLILERSESGLGI